MMTVQRPKFALVLNLLVAGSRDSCDKYYVAGILLFVSR